MSKATDAFLAQLTEEQLQLFNWLLLVYHSRLLAIGIKGTNNEATYESVARAVALELIGNDNPMVFENLVNFLILDAQ